VAQASATLTSSQIGYGAVSGPAPTQGPLGGQLALQQNVAVGPVTGSLNFRAGRSAASEPAVALVGQAVGTQSLQGAAQMRVPLTPALAVVGSGTLSSSLIDVVAAAPADTTPAPDAVEPPSDAATAGAAPPDTQIVNSQLTQAAAGDMGLEMKLPHKLAMTLSTGYTRTLSGTYTLSDWQTASLTDESRIGLELAGQAPAGSWGVKITHKIWGDQLAQAGSDMPTQSATVFSFNCRRRLSRGVALAGSIDWARQAGTFAPLASRRAQGSVTLNKLGTFSAGYLEGPTTLFSLQPNPINDVSRQWSLGWSLGGAGTSGLGLGVNYAQSLPTSGPVDYTWHIGISLR
jgi:hypothetical protein